MSDYYDEFSVLDNRQLAKCYRLLKENGLTDGSDLLAMLKEIMVLRFVYENTEHQDTKRSDGE